MSTYDLSCNTRVYDWNSCIPFFSFIFSMCFSFFLPVEPKKQTETGDVMHLSCKTTALKKPEFVNHIFSHVWAKSRAHERCGGRTEGEMEGERRERVVSVGRGRKERANSCGYRSHVRVSDSSSNAVKVDRCTCQYAEDREYARDSRDWCDRRRMSSRSARAMNL